MGGFNFRLCTYKVPPGSSDSTSKPYPEVRVRIPYTYRTPYQSIGTEGLRYTGKNLILVAEMVRSTGCFFKIEYGYGYGKNLVKNHGTEYGTYTGCL